jgi:hypothetical protein
LPRPTHSLGPRNTNHIWQPSWDESAVNGQEKVDVKGTLVFLL